MLHLAARTEPEWVDWILAYPEELLIDHAHCEMKAASTAMGIAFRYSQYDFLAAPLSRFAREELSHFEAVLHMLERRNIRFRGLAPSPYARKLREKVRPDDPDQFVDTMVCCALIEARSCERFQILSDHCSDKELAGFFEKLLASEARHHQTFLDLCAQVVGREETMQRLEALAPWEVEVLKSSPDKPRLHNGGLRGLSATV